MRECVNTFARATGPRSVADGALDQDADVSSMDEVAAVARAARTKARFVTCPARSNTNAPRSDSSASIQRLYLSHTSGAHPDPLHAAPVPELPQA